MKDKKLEVLKFIKDFNKINVKTICKQKGLMDSNVCRASTTLENMLIVKKELKKQVIEWLGSDLDV